jgi:hypothetical protein
MVEPSVLGEVLTFDLDLPRGMTRCGHFGAIGAYHFIRVRHQHWDRDTDKGQDQEANL